MEAVQTIEAVGHILEHIGINPQRLSLQWVSAAEAPRYVEIVTSFTERIRALGPLGVREGIGLEVLTRRLTAARNFTQQEKFRWILGKRTEFSKEGNKYGEVFTHHELNRLLRGLILEDLQIQEILGLIQSRALSTREIAERLQLTPAVVLNHLSVMRRRKLVEVKEVTHTSPRYLALAKEDEKGHEC